VVRAERGEEGEEGEVEGEVEGEAFLLCTVVVVSAAATRLTVNGGAHTAG